VRVFVNGHLEVRGFGQLKVRTLWGSSALLPR
jgi:serine kinase of HPr protein (carbohydrate metabolism regulator)